jgi:GWxTD domain-containing protein
MQWLKRLGFLLISLLLCQVPVFGQKDREKARDAQRSEEAEKYFQKWLSEDVVYIINPEEKSVFEQLTTPEEKEQFIEQFWYRRDPDPRTSENEFKEEHYRRIAYANERFASGYPGWLTDRGRIYIMHGPPAEIESRPSGGQYLRPINEGGGTTSTFPFEIWRYRNIDGVGDDILLEFVDASLSGEYKLALRPEDKDALLYVPGAGLTMDEQMGVVGKEDREFFNPASGYSNVYSAKDNPFNRWETYTNVQRPPQIKYNDLQQIVEIGVSYEEMPLQVSDDYIKLNDRQVLVPITVELKNKDMTFELRNGVYVAQVGVYAVVTSITNRIIKEFEDDLVATYPPDKLEWGRTGRSVYQKIVPLEAKMRYKIDLVVKDLNSGNIGVVRKALAPPSYGSEKLETSSLIIADHIRFLEDIPKDEQMFVLGDVMVRPKIDRAFRPEQQLGLYLQVHNAAFDQTTSQPSLKIHYTISEKGKTLIDEVDTTGDSVQFFSSNRIVLVKGLQLKDLSPGSYRLDVKIEDLIGNQTVTASDRIRIKESEPAAGG